jgi:hypothetical protein
MTFPVIPSAVVLQTREQVLARPSPVPRSPGIYAWFFDVIPPGIDATGFVTLRKR